MVVTNADLAGAPIHVAELSIGLRRVGHEVEIVFGESGLTHDKLVSLGFNCHVIPSLRSNLNVIADILACKSLIKFVVEFGADLVHAHSSKAGFISRIAGVITKVPVIYTVHGWGFGPGRRILISSFVFVSEILVCKFTGHFIFVSSRDRSIGRRWLRISPSRGSVIFNSCRYEKRDSPFYPEELTVIMVARNDYQKDYTTFFRALGRTNVRRVLVVGAGTDKPEFKRLAFELSRFRGAEIEFLGIRSDVGSLLEQASLFVLSSRFEGLPISIIEAMSKGLPIVASDVGGVRELVRHGDNGFLFAAGDCFELANLINKFSQDIALVRRCGAASLSRFSNDFSREVMVDKATLVYARVLMKGVV